MFSGSLARKSERAAFVKGGGSARRKELLEKGVLTDHDENSYIFTQDYIFQSPSAACGAIIARSCNGWTGWKDKEGKTLEENKRK